MEVKEIILKVNTKVPIAYNVDIEDAILIIEESLRKCEFFQNANVELLSVSE